jgi:hypothetical protein
MAMTRLELGTLYTSRAGQLALRCIGSVLNLSLHIRQGWYANPNANQTAWAAHVFGCTEAEKMRIAREAMEWGLVNNDNLQSQGEALPDGDLDFIVAEYTKTWEAPSQ